jgi:UPF0271 protein
VTLLSADVGEGGEHDDELLSLIDSANVCCGVHAGSAALTIETATKCQELGVEVVAHPGYDDRRNVGRIEVGLDVDAIERLVAFQVAALCTVVRVYFVKPHGALYHRCQEDPDAAAALLRAASRFSAGVVGQPGFGIVETARRGGIPYRREAFADRAYEADGKLKSRSEPDAVLAPGAAAEQAARFLEAGGADTICIHSDSPGAVAVARAVRQRMSTLAT